MRQSCTIPTIELNQEGRVGAEIDLAVTGCKRFSLCSELDSVERDVERQETGRL